MVIFYMMLARFATLLLFSAIKCLCKVFYLWNEANVKKKIVHVWCHLEPGKRIKMIMFNVFAGSYLWRKYWGRWPKFIIFSIKTRDENLRLFELNTLEF